VDKLFQESTHVDDGLNRPEDSSHGGADQGDLGEDTGLANEDVQECLVNPDELEAQTRLVMDWERDTTVARD
jgi:hypothetical protein